MKLIPIALSELSYYGKSSRFVDGLGPFVDQRCIKRRIRKSVRRALRQLMVNESIRSRAAACRMLKLALKSHPKESQT